MKSEIERIYVVNPNHIPSTAHSYESLKTVSDLVKEVKSNDIIVWCNFPDGLEDGQNPQRGREALVKVSSSLIKTRRLFLTLNPAYRELYRGIASKSPERKDDE
jgi:hypothetical protein